MTGSVDASCRPVYDEVASGRLGDRGHAIGVAEESPYFAGHGAGESPGWSDLSDWATEKNSRDLFPGDGEKAAQETTGVHSNVYGQATPVGSKVKQRRWSGPLLLAPCGLISLG